MKYFSIISFVIILACSCSSEDSADTKQRSKYQELLSYEEITERDADHKISLICFKHEIDSKAAIGAIVEYVLSKDYSQTILAHGQEADIDQFISLMTDRKYRIDELRMIANTHGLQVNNIASILYDYEIWKSTEHFDE